MSNGLTVTVEGFGPIEHAEVEVRPLTLFVGENNSGKSYLATLLWGLQQRDFRTLLSKRASEFPSVKACIAVLEKWKDEASDSFPPLNAGRQVVSSDAAPFLDWLDEAIESSADSFVQDAFRESTMKVGRMRLRGPVQPATAVAMRSVEDKAATTLTVQVDNFAVSVAIDTPAQRLNAVSWVATSLRGLGRPASFLPASRTGFLLLYRSFISSLLDEDSPDSEELRSQLRGLTLPSIRFIRKLLNGFGEPGPFRDVATFLEQGLRGQVVSRRGSAVQEYFYRPEGEGTDLRMALASTLVTELAPIILTLGGDTWNEAIFIEEPEAHLHPRIQRHVARAVGRLVRRGAKLVLTTHAEDFCQQVNNLIKLGGLPGARRAQLQREQGYEESDFLLPEEVAGYQFVVGAHGRTRVTEVDRTPYGLVMQTFNGPLAELGREAITLGDALAELPDTGT